MPKDNKRTRIVATIGPASESVKTLQSMMRAGVNVVRLNFSHGDHAEHSKRLSNIRAAAKKSKKDIAILQDLGGVKIRIGDFAGGSVTLRVGCRFVITTQKIMGDENKVYINYKKLPQEIDIGQEILLDDGSKKLVVTKIDGNEIETKVIVGGMIRSRRGVNIPGARLSCSALTAKDKQDVIDFGVKNDVDYIALSFVRSATDIMALKRILHKHSSHAKVIAKIETPEAVNDIDAIISQADGIMVARGDLAVEMPACDVPHLQKMIIKKCNIVGKPVIVATQMLESMITASVPTRAEVTDVANAILDGTDAVMLSAESAVGAFPIKVVKVMAEIACRTEREITSRVVEDVAAYAARTVNAVSHSAIHIADDIGAAAVVALTESGFSARKIARHRSPHTLVALTPHPTTVRHLQLTFGCDAHVARRFTTVMDAVTYAKKFVRKEGYAKKGERIVIVAGIPFDRSGTTNMVIVEEV